MKTLSYNILVVFLIALSSFLSGCGTEESPIDDSLPPGIWIVCKDGIAVSDTISGFRCDCLIEIPAEGGTYRIQGLDNSCFESYEIEQPIDHPELLTVVSDNKFTYPRYYDVTYAANETEISRLFTIRLYGRKNQSVLLVSAYQPPR